MLVISGRSGSASSTRGPLLPVTGSVSRQGSSNSITDKLKEQSVFTSLNAPKSTKEFKLSIGTIFHKLELIGDNKIEASIYRPEYCFLYWNVITYLFFTLVITFCCGMCLPVIHINIILNISIFTNWCICIFLITKEHAGAPEKGLPLPFLCPLQDWLRLVFYQVSNGKTRLLQVELS